MPSALARRLALRREIMLLQDNSHGRMGWVEGRWSTQWVVTTGSVPGVCKPLRLRRHLFLGYVVGLPGHTGYAAGLNKNFAGSE